MTLHAMLEAHLHSELGDADTARALADAVYADALSWRAPTVAVGRITTLFAFTFGNRMLPNGNREPGPVNEALADVVAGLHAETGARVYAQWEVAAALHGRVSDALMTTINPVRDARGEPVYLGTTAVLEGIVQTAPPATLGCVGVVAFADHQHRCAATARRLGFDAFAPEGVAMPRTYDPQSGQAWCRSRLAYLLHDIMIRITERRCALVGADWN
jgi:hypothetical protein